VSDACGDGGCSLTLDDVLELVLTGAEDPSRIFTRRDTEAWEDGVLEWLLSKRLLVPAGNGRLARCPACSDGHLEEVVQFEGDDRLFIGCPERGRVQVERADCDAWRVDRGGLARVLCDVIRPGRKPRELRPAPAWKLGKVTVGGDERELVVAFGLTAPGGDGIAVSIGKRTDRVFLVPDALPARAIWPDIVPPSVVSLRDLLEVEDEQLLIDGAALLGMVEEAETIAQTAEGVRLSAVELNRIIRRESNKASDEKLTDEFLAQAVRQYGGIRPAARELEKEGHSINPSTISRRLQRAGLDVEVLASEDSPSVARGVASQPRNRGKKFEEHR